jgi:hypothetical protein
MVSRPVFPVSQLGLSRSATGPIKTLRLRSESPPEFQLRREAARRRLLAESALRFRLRHALLGLASAILRLEVALQNESAWVSPLSVRFWRPKAVFLWRLVAKSAKIFNPVTSGDMSVTYIGAGLWGNRNRDECQGHVPEKVTMVVVDAAALDGSQRILLVSRFEI